MAVAYNTSLVSTRGLIYYIDAANKRSYPGSGTSVTDLTNTYTSSSLVNGTGFSSLESGRFVFDGTNDTIRTFIRAENDLKALSSWTMTCWFKITNFPTGGSTNRDGVVFGSTYYAGTAIYFSCTPAGDFRIRGYIRGEDAYRATSDFSLSVNTVYMFTTVNDRSDTTFKLYRNNELLQSISGPTQEYNPTLTPVMEDVHINRNHVDGGGEQTYTYFTGNVYAASIWNRALSGAEITQNFNALRGRFGI